jgi:hypothetical protein
LREVRAVETSSRLGYAKSRDSLPKKGGYGEVPAVRPFLRNTGSAARLLYSIVR